MKAIVAVLLKDGKMMYLKNGGATNVREEATIYDDYSEAQSAMNSHSLYGTIYPMAWFILVQNEDSDEWAIKHHIIYKSDYSY